MEVDLNNPEVRAMLKSAYAIIAKARAKRLAREREAQEQEVKKSA